MKRLAQIKAAAVKLSTLLGGGPIDARELAIFGDTSFAFPGRPGAGTFRLHVAADGLAVTESNLSGIGKNRSVAVPAGLTFAQISEFAQRWAQEPPPPISGEFRLACLDGVDPTAAAWIHDCARARTTTRIENTRVAFADGRVTGFGEQIC